MNHVFERAGLTVLERGWLSSNSIWFHRHVDEEVVLVDSGYHSHSMQTVALVRATIGHRQLNRIVNTHLHSDHCGGNHALQLAFDCKVDVPKGEADAVDLWDESRLSFIATGQDCPRFLRSGSVDADTTLTLGGLPWQAIAAPGHDPVAVIFYQPELKILISADALWQNGFGVVFPELEGEDGFSDVRRTLDRIAALELDWVIPGHGQPFQDVSGSLNRAYERLDGIVQNPARHAMYAAKVLVRFHVMDVRSQSTTALTDWMRQTPLLGAIHDKHFNVEDKTKWLSRLLEALCNTGAISIESDTVWDVN